MLPSNAVLAEELALPSQGFQAVLWCALELLGRIRCTLQVGFVVVHGWHKRIIMYGPAIAKYYLCHGTAIIDVFSVTPFIAQVPAHIHWPASATAPCRLLLFHGSTRRRHMQHIGFFTAPAHHV